MLHPQTLVRCEFKWILSTHLSQNNLENKTSAQDILGTNLSSVGDKSREKCAGILTGVAFNLEYFIFYDSILCLYCTCLRQTKELHNL